MRARAGLAIALAGVACGGGEGRQEDGSSDAVTVFFTDDGAPSARRLGRAAPEPCVLPEHGTAGQCVTPDSVRGWASQLELGTANGMNEQQCGPGRLLSIAATTDVGGPPRGGGAFDLAETRPIGGYSNLECGGFVGASWARLSVEMAHADVDVTLGERRFTVRFVFESNPITLEAPIAACGLPDDYVASYDYLPGASVRRGDVLACVREPGAPACADADFAFVDLDGDAFVAERPAHPLTMGYLALQTVAPAGEASGDVWCNMDCGDDRSAPDCGFELGGYAMGFALPEDARLGLWAELVTSDDARHPEGDGPPAKLYTVDAGGARRSGYEPQITVGFDLTDLLFLAVEPATDVAAMADVAIVRAMSLADMANRRDPSLGGVAPIQPASLAIDFAAPLP